MTHSQKMLEMKIWDGTKKQGHKKRKRRKQHRKKGNILTSKEGCENKEDEYFAKCRKEKKKKRKEISRHIS